MRNLMEIEGLVVVGDELCKVRMQRLLDQHQFQCGKGSWSGGGTTTLMLSVAGSVEGGLAGKAFHRLGILS